MSKLREKAIEIAKQTSSESAFMCGYNMACQEYEEKLRWIPVEEFKFIIKDSDNPDTIICKEDNRYSVIEITDLYSVNYVKNNFSHCRYFL